MNSLCSSLYLISFQPGSFGVALLLFFLFFCPPLFLPLLCCPGLFVSVFSPSLSGLHLSIIYHFSSSFFPNPLFLPRYLLDCFLPPFSCLLYAQSFRRWLRICLLHFHRPLKCLLFFLRFLQVFVFLSSSNC